MLNPEPGPAARPKAALKLVDTSAIASDKTTSAPASDARLLSQHANSPAGCAVADDAASSALRGLSQEARSAKVLSLILSELDDDKAEDIVTIDLAGKSDIADAMVVASGRSQRHVSAMADQVMRRLKDAGLGSVRCEGQPACDWVLIDAQDVIVHLFRPEVRSFYNLEKIWSESAHIPHKD